MGVMRTILIEKAEKFKTETEKAQENEKGRKKKTFQNQSNVYFTPKQHYLTHCNLTFESICDGVCLHEN